MAKTSSHVIPLKTSTEVHNFRRYEAGKEPDYIRTDLTHKNESFVVAEINSTRKEIQELYKKSTGQKMQDKATPIRESVIVLDKNTSMDQLKRLGQAFESRFGIRTLQIHIHDDEGHWSKKTGEWMPNRHAHMVFNWTHPETGKSIKLKKLDMIEMQDLTAEYLDMERGTKSTKKHVSAMAYKAQAMLEELEEIKREIKEPVEKLKQELENVYQKHNKLIEVHNGLKEKHNSLEQKNSEIESLFKTKNKEAFELNQENTELKIKLDNETQLKQHFEKDLNKHKTRYETISLSVGMFFRHPSEEQKLKAKEFLLKRGDEAINQAKETAKQKKKQDQEQQKGKGPEFER